MPAFHRFNGSDPQLRLLALVIACGLAVLLVGLWWVQIVSARDYQSALQTQSSRTIRIPAVRGKILDRNGIALADSQPSYDVSLYLEELRDQFKAEYSRLRPTRTVTNSLPFWKRLLSVSAVNKERARLPAAQREALEWQARYNVASNVVEKVGERLQTPLPLDFNAFKRHYTTRLALPYTVARDLNPTEIARFEEGSWNIPAVNLEIEARRVYPYQTTAAHLLGYVIRDDKSIEGEEAFFSYRMPDYRGVIGVEGGYDKSLHGHAGEKSVLVNNVGYRQMENVWTPAEPGSAVVLTIDLRIQQEAERSLARHVGPNARAAVVVMDVHTGDLLALVSSPAINPNYFVQGFPPAEAARLNDPTLRPQINRATQENYAPGSIFKPLVGLACLETGMDPRATIYSPGHIYVGRRLIRDLAPPGNYDFRRAILKSCNSYFITNGMRAGIERIVNLGQRLHLGERTGLPTRQETGGVFPNLKRINSRWFDGDTANLCIGQGQIAVTPLQMAVMTAAFANGGKVLWPRLVDRIEPQAQATGEKPMQYPTARARDELGVRAANLQIVREAMLADVEDPEGTGRAAAVLGLRICGKTGTAEVMNERNQIVDRTTWFISFAPFEKPRFAVVVMVESGNFGGTTCAPIAHDIYLAIQAKAK